MRWLQDIGHCNFIRLLTQPACQLGRLRTGKCGNGGVLDGIEESNKAKLEGVFRNIDFNSEGNLGKTKDRNRRLHDVADARIVLEEESPQSFDVLVLDAFSSDAIPVHLLTREAFSVYLRHLTEDGVLAVHISNVHVDLSPVVAGQAAHFRLAMAGFESLANDDTETRLAIWMLLSRNARSLEIEAVQQAQLPPPERELDWTDQRNSVFRTLRAWR